MQTFSEFLQQEARHGSVNLVFESGMYSLFNDLEQIIKILQKAAVPFEVIGGVAVIAHLLPRHRSRSFVTRDIDLLVRRDDLERIREAAETAGYTAKKMMGGFMLIRPEQQPAEAIHLVFAGEKSKSSQPLPHPDLHPEQTTLFGLLVPVAPLRDLLRMKLTSFRPKDMVHLQILDEAGLITPAEEQLLVHPLLERLQQARQQFAEDEPDV